LLHEVLGRLDPADEEFHRLRAQALVAGYTAEYGSEFLRMEPELPASDCELVWDLLDMFYVLRASLASVDPVLGLDGAALEFQGLDASDPIEGRLLSYARHVVDAGRWPDMAGYLDAAHDHGDSRRRMLPHYQRMLEAYRPLVQAQPGSAPVLLSADELTAVSRAAARPAAGEG
jgi:hypothetical protein